MNPLTRPLNVAVEQARTPTEYADFRNLIGGYLHDLGLPIDLQYTETEPPELQLEYGPERGGCALVARPAGAVVAIGIVGIRRVDEATCELKRMYVRRPWRNFGVGRALCEHAVAVGAQLGYDTMLLRVLERMAPAIHIYESIGFEPATPCRRDPLHEVRHYALDITAAPRPIQHPNAHPATR